MHMSTEDKPVKAPSVEAGTVSDPILNLIARVEAESTQADRVTEADRALWDASVKALDPSETQAFMAKMSAANIAEFAERKRKARWVRIGLAVTVALVGMVLIGIGLAGGL